MCKHPNKKNRKHHGKQSLCIIAKGDCFFDIPPAAAGWANQQHMNIMQRQVRQQCVLLTVLLTGTAIANAQPATDWLINSAPYKATVEVQGKDIVLRNGLLQRTLRTAPNAACTDFTNLTTGQQLLRAVSPEARLVLNGKTYAVGGLYGQHEKAYLQPHWVDTLRASTQDFAYAGYTLSQPQPLVKAQTAQWWMPAHTPTGGLQINCRYLHPALPGVEVQVHYVLYDGMPVVSKWLTLHNRGSQPIRVDSVVHEILAMAEEESAVVGETHLMIPPQGIYIESNYAFNNAMRYRLSDQTTHWKADRSYTSQVNYDYKTPCLLEIYPEKAPGVVLQRGDSLVSIRSWELLHDSYDRERRGLAVRKMYRAIAPWVQANPIFMHLVSQNDAEVTTAIDQCAATGYEAVILSFGSHLVMEDSSRSNIARWKALADYAHSKGIKIGGYSLFSSRRIDDSTDVVSSITGKPGGAFFGHAPCFGSHWGLAYREKIKYFFAQTGFDIWENDGPYPGDVCASTSHPGHEGLHDSQWRQMEIQKELYQWLSSRGVYINAPDWYFLDGTHKTGLGYREVNFSLSREQQKVLNRQNIYDGTWEKTPSMGWGFVPLTYYQGGAPDAILEPLKDHLGDYKQLMFQYYSAGVQACYRGPRLYDADTTRRVVQDMVAWYKKYRDILNSDIIHLRRPDGRSWDGILHVNPQLPTKGLLVLYNPTKAPLTRTIQLPLYYTGLSTQAHIRPAGGQPATYQLARDYTVSFTFSLPAEGYSWYLID